MMAQHEDLWKKRDVARHLGVDVRTVDRMLIPRVALQSSGKKRPIVRYDPVQVREWWDAYRSRKVRDK